MNEKTARIPANMKLKELNSRFMLEKLNKGWTLSEFAKHFGVSEEYFQQKINKTFNESFLIIIKRDLRKNQKPKQNQNSKRSPKQHSKKHQNMPKLELTDGNTTDNLLTDITKVVEKVEYDMVADVNQDMSNNPAFDVTEIPDESSNDVVLNSCENDISKLFSDKENLENELNEWELRHKQLVTEGHSFKDSAVELKNKCEEYAKLLEEAKKSWRSLLEREKRRAEELDKVNASINECRVRIQTINDEIQNRQKVLVFVYASGECVIESTDATGMHIVESVDDVLVYDYDELCRELIAVKELENLQIKQVKVLAKVIRLSKQFTEQNRAYEVEFEDEISRGYFQKTSI